MGIRSACWLLRTRILNCRVPSREKAAGFIPAADLRTTNGPDKTAPDDARCVPAGINPAAFADGYTLTGNAVQLGRCEPSFSASGVRLTPTGAEMWVSLKPSSVGPAVPTARNFFFRFW